jgi:hypothetical protein
LRDGQVTFAVSWRTCWKNSTGLSFAMTLFVLSLGLVLSIEPDFQPDLVL